MAGAIVGTIVVLGLGVGVVVGLDVTPAHEHTAHEHSISDVAYDDQHDIVWSIDQDPEANSVTFAGYDVGEEDVVVTETFDNGHALTVGDGVVYIADQHTLWAYNVSAEESTELTRMEIGAGAMDYDADRGLVWVAGGGEGQVVAYDVETGDIAISHDVHVPNGLNDISVEGNYVATVATWEPEVVVYDIESEEVVFEPLPDSIAEADDGNLVSVHVTSSGKLIVGGGWDSVFLYDLASQELRSEYAAHSWGVAAVDYHESTDMIVSAGTGNSLAFYDVAANAVTQTYTHDDTIYAADLDTANGIVWFGDGEEQPGSITGLALTFDQSDGAQADESADATAAPDTDSAAETGDDDVSAGGDGPGFGLVAGLIALVGLWLVGYHRTV